MRWTVGKRIALAFGVLVAFLVSLAGYGLYRDHRIENAMTTIYQRGVISTQAIGRASAAMERIRGRHYLHAATTDPAAFERIEAEIEQLESEVDHQLTIAENLYDANDSRRQSIARMRDLRRTWAERRAQELYPVSRQGNIAQSVELVRTRLSPLAGQVIDEMGNLTNVNVERSREIYVEAKNTLDDARLISLIVTILVAVVAVGGGWLLARSIARRLADLASVAMAIRNGEKSRRASTEGDDEIHDVAVAFNGMTDSLAQSASELAEAAEEQRAAAANESAARERLSKTVAKYGAFVARVARGELNAELDYESDKELAALGKDLVSMAAGLRAMNTNIRDAVNALSTATAEILATTQEHSAGASESASAVAQTVTTVDEVTQTAQQAAERARSVASASQKSLEVSAAGRAAVARTIDAMSNLRQQVDAIAERILGLSEQAQAIGQVITTVNELAEQSNLLALNASIEAARAGEHGRGFAVVAQEIRALAEQSKRGTSQVRNILGDIQKSATAAVLVTEQGGKAAAAAVDTVRDAGQRIEQLATTMAEAADAAQAIVGTAQQQVSGVGQIAQAMHAISSASEQTVQGTHQTARAASDLNLLSTRLREVVSQYRT